MDKKLKAQRMKLIYRQGELNQICKKCTKLPADVVKGRSASLEICEPCPIFAELQQIGEGLLSISKQRKTAKQPQPAAKQIEKKPDVAAKQQTKRVRQGEDQEMAAFDMPVKEYVQLKMEPVKETGKKRNDEEIAGLKGISLPTLTKWKTKHKAYIRDLILEEEQKMKEAQLAKTEPVQKVEVLGPVTELQLPEKSSNPQEELDKLLYQIKQLRSERNNWKQEYAAAAEANKQLKEDKIALEMAVASLEKAAGTTGSDAAVQEQNERLSAENAELKKELASVEQALAAVRNVNAFLDAEVKRLSEAAVEHKEKATAAEGLREECDNLKAKLAAADERIKTLEENEVAHFAEMQRLAEEASAYREQYEDARDRFEGMTEQHFDELVSAEQADKVIRELQEELAHSRRLLLIHLNKSVQWEGIAL